LSEPDYSQHDTAPGSQTSLAALKSSDNNLALLLGELERRGVRDKTDVFVVSDHGFSTIREGVDVSAALRSGGFNAHREFKTAPATNDVVVVGNGGSVLLYVIGRDSTIVRRIVTFLQQQEFTGTIFTREPMEGAFALELAKINSADTPDIAFSMRWRPDANIFGAHGLVMTDTDEAKVKAIRVLAMIDIFFGTHVTTSRYDLHNTLIAAGPDFKKGLVSQLPSGNVDVAPTLLHILGVQPPQPMDGRVLTEALTIPGPAVGSPKTTILNATNRVGNRVWRQYLKRTELNGVVYLDEGNGGVAAN
jgi:arylsulfatase A-like enzyme